MKYTYLGKSGMKVSRLCLGTMNFGAKTGEEEAFKIMDRALDAGINYFDTANSYGKGSNGGYYGLTEEIIGRWFSQGGGRRESIVLGTKVYDEIEDKYDGPNGGRGLSAYKIRRHMEGSLKRLQTDHVEIYQMHHIDRNVTWDELWGIMEILVQQGKAYYIGSSNFAGHHIAYAQAMAEKRNFLGLISEQHKYNLLNRIPELEVLPAAKAHGLGVVAWSPLGGGMLNGKGLNRDLSGQPERKRQLEEYSKLCKEFGESEADVALAWLLSNPAVTAPIIGPRTLEQLENTLRAVEIELPEDVLKRLDEIFPGPGGEAPEAYAW